MFLVGERYILIVVLGGWSCKTTHVVALGKRIRMIVGRDGCTFFQKK
jgi:hypothetical protein